jgi:ABC-type glycerol-3-phosphate transport system substrate-binding protein
MLRLAIVLTSLLLLAGCGSEEDGGDSPERPSAPATELTVTVWPSTPRNPAAFVTRATSSSK